MRFKEVYHSSSVQGLEVITPRKSTHKKTWVYATWDPVMAAAFLGNLGGDFTCTVGRDAKTGKPFICERFQGALYLRYGHVEGSIYVLPGESFIANQTQWEEEVVSNKTVTPLREIRIANAKFYLRKLAMENELIIKRYPAKIVGVPEDDEDLVFRAVIWQKQFGSTVLDQVKKYHPHLLDRVLLAIKENKY